MAGRQASRRKWFPSTPESLAWDLALDRNGTRLAYLSGTVAPDGTVGQIHEVVYVNSAGSWQIALDLPVPFTKARGQAWAE